MSARLSFDESLAQLSNNLIRMGAMATDAVSRAISAIETGDEKLAQEVINGDSEVDNMEKEIEQQCLMLLLRQQPVARDLRKVSTAIKMITDIERVGDAASDIAEISLHLPQGIHPRFSDIQRMAAEARDMVADAIKAYVDESSSQADEVIARDDIVDNYFNEIKRELAKFIAEDPQQIDMAMDYLMIIKYLERLGDHAVNISEWVKFYKTGKHKDTQIV